MIAIRIMICLGSVAPSARRLDRQRLAGGFRLTYCRPAGGGPAGGPTALRSISYDPENLSSPALDEVHVASHRFAHVIALGVLGKVVLEVGQRLEFALEDDRPVAGHGVDHDPAIHEAVLGLHRGDGL